VSVLELTVMRAKDALRTSGSAESPSCSKAAITVPTALSKSKVALAAANRSTSVEGRSRKPWA